MAAKHATATIPIVMPVSADPVGLGLVASLADRAGTSPGSRAWATELAGKRMQLLKETVPESLPRGCPLGARAVVQQW